jgi:hypothetical protein
MQFGLPSLEQKCDHCILDFRPDSHAREVAERHGFGERRYRLYEEHLNI